MCSSLERITYKNMVQARQIDLTNDSTYSLFNIIYAISLPLTALQLALYYHLYLSPDRAEVSQHPRTHALIQPFLCQSSATKNTWKVYGLIAPNRGISVGWEWCVCVGKWGVCCKAPHHRGALKYPVMTVIIHTAEQWRWITECGRERSLGERKGGGKGLGGEKDLFLYGSWCEILKKKLITLHFG